MRIVRSIGIGALESTANVLPVPVVAEQVSNTSERPAVPDGPRASATQQARRRNHESSKAAELHIGSKTRVAGASGMVETYARIRIAEDSHMVMIQIINAANGEVIREIPPGAWEKMRKSFKTT